MHDIHTANAIIKLVLEEAKKKKLTKISKIKLELGQIVEHGQMINDENLAFNIKMLAKGSMAEDLHVEISTGKMDGWKLIEIEGE